MDSFLQERLSRSDKDRLDETLSTMLRRTEANGVCLVVGGDLAVASTVVNVLAEELLKRNVHVAKCHEPETDPNDSWSPLDVVHSMRGQSSLLSSVRASSYSALNLGKDDPLVRVFLLLGSSSGKQRS
jgi:hypothetical protein